MFVGGPYDGRDLPVDPSLTKSIRLPRPTELDPFVTESKTDPGRTGKVDWPFVYELNDAARPPHYRFVEKS